MCPCEFARVGGGIFIALAILGLFRVLGPTESASMLGGWLWIDFAEITFDGILGTLLIVASRASASVERPVVLLTGWLLLALAGFGLFNDDVLLMHVERPLQIIFYFAMGVWALLAGFCKDKQEERENSSSSPYKNI